MLLVHLRPELPPWPEQLAVSTVVCVLACRLRLLWLPGFLAGYLLTAAAAGSAVDTRLPPEFDRNDVQLRGWVDSFPESGPGRVQFNFSIDDADLSLLIGRRVRLSWYEPEIALAPGQQLSITARLREPHGLVNPAGFDYERWLLLQRIAATGYVRRVHASGARRSGFAPWLIDLRSRIRERVAQRVASPAAAKLITALSIGDRSGFVEADWDSFRRSGTSHLVAISGLHIGIVAMLTLWPVRWLARRAAGGFAEHCDSIAAIAAILAAVFYAGLAGFSVTTLRAVAMLVIALLIAGSRRRISRFSGFAAALVVVTAIDPLAPLGSSFWLSFGAVGVLLAAIRPRMVSRTMSSLVHRLRELTGVQLAISLAAIPAGAAFFQQVSLAAFLVNMAAIPYFSFILVPLVLGGVVIEMLIGLPAVGWQVVEVLAEQTMAALERIAAIPWTVLPVPAPDLSLAVFSLCGMLLALPWNPVRGRFIGMLAIVPLIWPRSGALPHDSFRMTVLDVGHGLAVIVETRSYVLVYDAGARFDSGFDAGRDVLLPALPGRRGPTTLVVSHGDNDHSGGAGAVLSAWPETEILVGPDVEIDNAHTCVAGQRWVSDGVEFEILHPAAEFAGRGNDSSCVLRIAASGGSALLTGDIEGAGERALVAGGDPAANIVIVPHHGSDTSSSAAFVHASAPSIAIVSAAYGNRWDFPRQPVVGRWCAAGAAVLVTGEHGAIEVSVSDHGPLVVALRSSIRRYWRSRGRPRCGESTGLTL